MRKMLRLLFLIPVLVPIACHKAAEPVEPVTPADTYELVWSDEFDYEGLPDTAKWSYDTEGNSWGWGNSESQFYTDSRPENAMAEGGKLYITARKESWQGRNFTSARLITKYKGDWLYGKVVVRAKLPGGRGLWPAIWMLPTDWSYGEWPASGEIDIMEHVGYMPDSVFASVHTRSFNHTIGTQKTKGRFIDDPYGTFHDYSLEWDENTIRMFVDGQLYFIFANSGKGFEEWPFDRRFHLLLNVAVGGSWGGAQGIDLSVFPQQMVVDYVRVYQRK